MTKTDFPFKILGIADDGHAYFTDDHNRLQDWKPQTIDKRRLLVLTDLGWWEGEYSKEGNGKEKVNWDAAINDVLIKSKKEEFDPDRIKGKGAWRSHDGKICYFDGNLSNTQGDTDPNWVLTKRVQKDIGLRAKHTKKEIRKEIYDINKTLLYSNKYEAAKLLAWATLAPFCGALDWRPACFVTASSGVGKSSLVKSIVIPLSVGEVFSGGSSTEAGIRQHLKNDAVPVIVEELEDDTKAKRENKEGIFSLMRQSTSNDSPTVVKGTSDGGGVKFAIRYMFLFVGISPEVSNEADDNRMVKINLRAQGDSTIQDWHKKESKLKELLNKDNADGIRAFTFDNLDKIFEIAQRMQPMIQRATGESARFAVVEAQLIACILVVWLEVDVSSEEKLKKWVNNFYGDYQKAEKVNDLDNLLDKLLDTEFSMNENDLRGSFTIRAILRYIKNDEMPGQNKIGYEDDIALNGYDKKSLTRIARQKGFGICNSKDNDKLRGHIMIAKNSQWAKKTLEGRAYYELLKRHDDYLGETTASMAGKTANCAVLGGVV